GSNEVAAVVRRAGVQVPAEDRDPLAHADQAAAGGGDVQLRPAAPAPQVDVDAVGAAVVADAHRGPRGVLEDVGQALLHDPVDGEIHAGREAARRAVEYQVNVEPGCPEHVDELRELRGRRLGR